MEAEPKSPSLTCPGSVSKMFPAFTSLRERNDQIRDKLLVREIVRKKKQIKTYKKVLLEAGEQQDALKCTAAQCASTYTVA